MKNNIQIYILLSLIIFTSYINITSSLYFELIKDNERCFIDEYYHLNVVMIKYEVIGIEPTDTETLKLIESLQIKLIKDDSSEIVSRHIIRKLSGKFSFTVDENAYYRICAQNVSSSYFNGKKIYMKMSIDSENSDEINLDNALRHHDVNPVSEKIEKIISKAKLIITDQENEHELEDNFSTLQMSYTHNFMWFTAAQIIGVLGAGIYHIYYFRKFLQNNNIIE